MALNVGLYAREADQYVSIVVFFLFVFFYIKYALDSNGITTTVSIARKPVFGGFGQSEFQTSLLSYRD